MDQSWGMAAPEPSVSWALCPQDPAWHMEGSAEEDGRKTGGLPVAQVEVRWNFCFSLKGHCVPGFSLTTLVDTVP